MTNHAPLCPLCSLPLHFTEGEGWAAAECLNGCRLRVFEPGFGAMERLVKGLMAHDKVDASGRLDKCPPTDSL